MEITGRISQLLPLQGGVSQATGKAWQSQTYIIETLEQYPRKVAIDFFGEERIRENSMQVGMVYTVSFDIESREYNGRWYTSVRGWKAQPATAQPAAQPLQPQQQAPAQQQWQNLQQPQAPQQQQVIYPKQAAPAQQPMPQIPHMPQQQLANDPRVQQLHQAVGGGPITTTQLPF